MSERPDPLAPPEGYGARPGAEPEEAADSGTCVHGACGQAAAWRVFLGDLAEHIARLNLCSQHALVFWLKQDGGISCHFCKQAMTLIRIESMADGTDWPLHLPEDAPPFPLPPQDLFGATGPRP